AFDVRPGIPRLALTGRHLRIEERFHSHILRGPERAREFDQLGEGESGPGNRHAPRFDAAAAVSALFKCQLAHQVVDADLYRLFHHAVDLHRPWPDRQRLRGGGDRFRGAELVEIIVVAVDLLVGDRPIESIFLVPLGGIKIGARIRQLGNVGQALSVRRVWRKWDSTGGSGQYPPAAEGQTLRRGKTIGDLPTAAANNIHSAGSQNPRPQTYEARRSLASHGYGTAKSLSPREKTIRRAGRSDLA